MCGITGLVNCSGSRTEADLETTVRAMAAALRHRGPDDQGVWTDAEAGLALGHTRLSILDVSSGGHQPMASRDGRHVLVFNGEIYNFRQIRTRLEQAGHDFRSDSDTEVLVEAISAWGVREALTVATGMFAFAVWDRSERTLLLARDRLGEKPLYYGWLGSSFVFASELKALCAHAPRPSTIDRGALTLYLRHGYVPGPHTIYHGIRKLQPGCFLRMTSFERDDVGIPEAYWSLDEPVAATGTRAPLGDADAVDALERLLRTAVQQQMVSDVPLGAFLSGGVDSASVVAMMQAESDRPVRTFTIGIADPARDEAPAARAIASHLGTAHTELYVGSAEALAVIPRLGTIYDEPFADSSQIPALLVAQLARRSVTVSLSGDGGDELFGGYAAYSHGPRVEHRIKRVPALLRRPLGHALLARPVRTGFAMMRRYSGALLATRADRWGEMLQLQTPLAIHRALYSHWLQPAEIVIGGSEPGTLFTPQQLPWPDRSFAERMTMVDAGTYLPDDLLVKVDRAAMSVSLETRVPLLDHLIVEFALRLPWEMKVRDGVRKWILRQVLYRHVPQQLFSGPKKGFGVPIAEWLRGPLREWADALLNGDRLDAEGFFQPEPIRERWAEHTRGTHDWSESLWTILMFQAWYETQQL